MNMGVSESSPMNIGASEDASTNTGVGKDSPMNARMSEDSLTNTGVGKDSPMNIRVGEDSSMRESIIKKVPIGVGALVAMFGLVFVGGVAVAVTNEAGGLGYTEEIVVPDVAVSEEVSSTEKASETSSEPIAAEKPEFNCRIEEVQLEYFAALEPGSRDDEAEDLKMPEKPAGSEVYFVSPEYHNQDKPLVLSVKGEANDMETDLILSVSIERPAKNGKKENIYRRDFPRSSGEFASGVELTLENFTMEPMQEFLSDLREYEILVAVKMAGEEETLAREGEGPASDEETLASDEVDTTTFAATYLHGWGGTEEENWPILMPESKVVVGTLARDLVNNFSVQEEYEIRIMYEESPGELVASEDSTAVSTRAHLMLVDSQGSRLAEIQTVAVGGDCNGDGRISAIDLLIIRSHLIGKLTLTGAEYLAADFSKDGVVSALDLLVVQRYLIANGQIN